MKVLPIVTLLCLLHLTHCASPPGDVVGKVSVGYQGWWSAIGDGGPGIGHRPAWWHWADNWFEVPSEQNRPIISTWPDMRDYKKQYKTKYPDLGNNKPATLFSSYDKQTVEVHFSQMKKSGIDTVAMQRSNPEPDSEGPMRDAVTSKVMATAEKYGRKVYIMFCLGGKFDVKGDWTNKISNLTKSPAYARQNEKPVVAIWGCGYDFGEQYTADYCHDLITWFKEQQGTYVIGGIPFYWRRENGETDDYFPRVYSAFDMISPWGIGVYDTLYLADLKLKYTQTPDMEWCNERGIDYQPCVFPGDLSRNVRLHGDFYWHNFYNMKKLGAHGLYVTMFDEYQEGNQIAKTAESIQFIPKGSNFTTLDEDGTKCSADYYLRLTRDGGKMFKGLTRLSENRTTVPWKPEM